MRLQGLTAGFAVCGALLFAASPLFADTIVLKNGKRISALSITERGDKIEYETSSGTLSLPKSIIDHIERGGTVGSYAQAAASLTIAPPVLESLGLASAGNVIEQGAVHDGMVDRGFIAKIENEARSGGRVQRESAALAHHTAAQFEMLHGNMDQALADERAALTYTPEKAPLLLNIGYLHLKRSEFRESIEYLDRARRIAPDDPEVGKLAGWAYYGLNRLNDAIAEWKRSESLRKDPEVEAGLEKAQRDKSVEDEFKENESAHFTLRYSGSSEPELARQVLQTLEMHYNAIESELRFSTPDPIGVILYTRQAFTDVTKAPDWVGALNDGRIRVPVQGLVSMTPALSIVLKHELVHSFVQQKTHGRAPTWLQEGLAQWMEGSRSGQNSGALLDVFDAKQSISLKELEGSWMQFPNGKGAYAYAWSLANVEAIVQQSGMSEIEQILDHIAAGETPESALQSVDRSNYQDLERSTIDYLRRNYGRPG